MQPTTITRPTSPAREAGSQSDQAVKHTSPASAIDHGFPPGTAERPFARFGILLPVLMLGLIPSLVLLYISKTMDIPGLFLGSSVLTLVLISGSSIILIISGVMGASEYFKRRQIPGHNKYHLAKHNRRKL